MGRKQNPLSARVKRMMQADVEVSRRSREVLLLAQFTGSNSPQHACRKQYVMHAQRMDFLKHKFAEVPDLPEYVPGAAGPPKPKAPKPKKRQRPDDSETQAPVAKGSKDTPILQQTTEITPFAAPPIAAGAGAMNSKPTFAWGGKEVAAAATPAAGAQAVDAVASTQATTTGAATADVATGAAQAAFSTPGIGSGILPQTAQPVAAEEDDYDED